MLFLPKWLEKGHFFLKLWLEFQLKLSGHPANRNFIVATATLLAVIFSFHVSALSCFVMYETFDMLQQQETLYFRYTNFGSHVQFKNN